ncbi:ATP-binding protein [Kordiimonas aestuarii]|uniref:ATP-binding protein n=1 Tax=Kordiimonas aestuarii TaxID=1005925 RepID=UPI0021D3C691|nr:ATP-binding protein [Kordiimonas aestuarii]
MIQEFDLTPDPRVLQMLGEINLHQWRCIAELLDNSIDGFLDAERTGSPVDAPEICVALPMADNANARIEVKDNGPGMSFEVLENAVKAGWSGQGSVNSLGLFGMGFNIATARLGLVTEVWTSRKGDPEEVGVRIDLDDLRISRNFKVPRQTRPKPDHTTHGTTIVITRLKPDQRAYLARGNNQKTIRKHLERAYSPILERTGTGKIHIKLGSGRLRPRRHCVWGEDRTVTYPDGSVARAVEIIDAKLAPRRYCISCMRTLAPSEEHCPTGTSNCEIEEIARSVRGWIGLQRYLHASEFGIDFVRNGRKIEISNKDLFEWNNGDSRDVEYPVDDPRNRGRFVGEIHIDHCRVSYTKDRFERDDPSWNEMVRIVRGDGPLRPILAKQHGYSGNDSPLYKMFQAFRRSSPQGKNGLWSRVLVVRDNERAQQMAEQFSQDDPDYLTDEPWWQLVQEQDKEAVGDLAGDPADPPLPGGFIDEPTDGDPTGDPATPAPAPVVPEPVVPVRHRLHELSQKYVHPTFRVEYDVQAFQVFQDDPDLPTGLPWLLKLDDVSTRTYAFLVDATHDIFRSTTMMPLDALLTELTFRTAEFLKGQAQNPSVAGVLADFRKLYCVDTRLDPQEIITLATSVLGDIARAIPSLAGLDGNELYEELDSGEQQSITRRMANRGVPDHKRVIAEGRFWDYANFETLQQVFNRHPEMFLDGKFWDDAYEALDFGNADVTDEARSGVRARYDAYFRDAVWLANQTAADIERADRDVVIRATCSVRLLRQDTAG